MGNLLSGEESGEKPAQQPPRPLSKAEKKKKREQERIKKRLPNRATYDLPSGMKEQIASIAEEHGTTASQVAAFLLNKGIKQVKSGAINLDKYKEPSASIRWDYNIRIED